MANSVTVAANTAGFTGATATLNTAASDRAGFVTFTTASTIPASPYKLFTLTWATSWNATYQTPPVLSIVPYPLFTNSRTQANVAAASGLGPFYAVPSAGNTTVDVYCTNAPAITTAYDISYSNVQGP